MKMTLLLIENTVEPKTMVIQSGRPRRREIKRNLQNKFVLIALDIHFIAGKTSCFSTAASVVINRHSSLPSFAIFWLLRIFFLIFPLLIFLMVFLFVRIDGSNDCVTSALLSSNSWRRWAFIHCFRESREEKKNRTKAQRTQRTPLCLHFNVVFFYYRKTIYCYVVVVLILLRIYCSVSFGDFSAEICMSPKAKAFDTVKTKSVW